MHTPCRACVKTNRKRCTACDPAFRHWLTGGAHYVPLWNGVVGAPLDADEPRNSLDRALAQKTEE